MAQINQEFERAAYHLTAIAYEKDIDCPAIPALNMWVRRQTNGSAPSPAEPSAKRAKPEAEPRSGEESTISASDLLTTLGTAPSGLTTAELRTMFPTLKAGRIGPMLASLARQKLAEKREDRWIVAQKAEAATEQAAEAATETS